MRRLVLSAAIGAAVILGAAGAAQAVERGGKMVYARYADSLQLDPVFTDANVDIWIMTNLYDTLLEPTPDGKGIVPGLAAEYAVSPDGKMLTLKMRPNLKWANGEPLQTSDVKWSLDRARNPKNGPWNELLGSIESVEVKGSDTVILHLKHADPTLPAALATFNAEILPEKPVTAAAGATDEEKAKSYAEHPLGSGPFMFASWSRNTEMVLKRNPYYWRNGEDGKPLPYLDELHFVIIPDDATRILKLQAGEVDGAEFIPFSRAAELKADPKINMELFPSTRVSYLTMNVRPTLKDGKPNPLNNAKLRQALNYAVDKNAINQVVVYGLGQPERSFMSSTTPYFSGPGPAYPYDVAKAKQLLQESGVGNGLEITSMALAGNADETATLTAIQQMWGQIGVKLKIEQLDNATRTAKYRAADFQMRYSVWTNDINDPSEITSYFAYFPNIESLHSGYRSPRIEELYKASQEENDAAKRGAQYKEIQEIYMQEAPIVFLYESPYAVALRKKVKGFLQIPLGNNIFAATYVEK